MSQTKNKELIAGLTKSSKVEFARSISLNVIESCS